MNIQTYIPLFDFDFIESWEELKANGVEGIEGVEDMDENGKEGPCLVTGWVWAFALFCPSIIILDTY